MNWDQVSDRWPDFKQDIRGQWGRLSEREIYKVAGRFDRFLVLIQQKYGLAKNEAHKEINNWLCDYDKRE